jgi:branched-chain amino acid transport system substrate-binding protein
MKSIVGNQRRPSSLVRWLLLTTFLFAVILPAELARSAFAETKASGGDAKPPIRIGFVASLTGNNAADGQAMLNGINLFLDEAHNKISGREVKLVVIDDECSPVKCVGKLKKAFENNEVDVLAGFLLSPILYAAAPVIEQANVPLVCSASGADDLTQRHEKRWLTRAARSNSQPTQALGDYAAKQLHYKKVVTVACDFAYGWEAVGGFQKSFEDAGDQVVQKLWAPMDSQDYSTLIKSIRKDADAAFICMAGKSSLLFPKQYKEYGPQLPVIGAEGTFLEPILPTVGEDLVGGIGSMSYTAEARNSANEKFVKAYVEKYGQEPDYISEACYTTGRLISEAIDSLKGDVSDKDKLMVALRHAPVDRDPRGPMKIDSYGNPVENIYICKVEKVKNRYQNSVIYTYPMISQFWKWTPDEFLKQPHYSKSEPPCAHCSP